MVGKRLALTLASHIPRPVLRRIDELQRRNLVARRLVAGATRWLRQGEQTIRWGAGRGLLMDLAGSRPGYLLGMNERVTQDFLCAHVQPGDSFYDIGANVGFFSLIGARLVGPAGHVSAFEPSASNASALRRNLELNGFRHVELIEAAVAERAGVAEFVVGKSDQDGRLRLDAGEDPGQEISRVRVVSIDEEVGTGRVPPSLVKIDAEGAEYEVIRGMASVLANQRPIVICEIHESKHQCEHPVITALKAAGYRVEWLEEHVERGDLFWAPHLAAFPC